MSSSYVSNRVLKINVGFLLSSGPGHSHDSVFDVPTVRVSDDLTLEFVRGPIRMSRATAGILVQGQLEAGVSGECYRCLEPVSRNVTIGLEELYTYPASTAAAFSILEDGILNLAPLLREEVLLATANGLLCRPDCKGLCPNCGANRNSVACTCGLEAVDPRLLSLKKLLE